jgi:hypothetical protein
MGCFRHGYSLSCTDTGPLEQSHHFEWGKEQRRQSGFSGPVTTVLFGGTAKAVNLSTLLLDQSRTGQSRDRETQQWTDMDRRELLLYNIPRLNRFPAKESFRFR